jgi:CheY-like chemotaxis protein
MGHAPDSGGSAQVITSPSFCAMLPPSPSPDRRSQRILCVDDEPIIRDVLAIQLRRLAYEVVTVPDGAAALALIAEASERFDAVITDNQMPNMCGLELVERLRQVGFPGRIVFFSSTLASESEERLRRLNVDAVVQKGGPPAELITALNRVCGRISG